MEITIKKIRLENFKNFVSVEFEFPNQAHTVYGRNASGKSTIVDGVTWALFDKLADGTTANKIRPVDILGNVKHYVDIKVELTLDVDGKEMLICKTQSEVWTTPRGKAEQEFGGNKNTYEVNGVPMTEKAYKAKIAEIINEDVFRFASVLGAFTGLEQKKRREMLLKLADAEAVDNILREEYPDLYTQYLDKYTVEEVNAMTAKALKEYKKELDTIPIRIDELAKQRASGNLNQLLGEAAEIRHKITSLGENATERINQLNAEKRRLIQEAEIENADRKYAAQKEVSKARDTVDNLERALKKLKHERSADSDLSDILEEKIDATRNEYIAVMQSDFEGGTVCHTCGQPLPATYLEEAKEMFEVNRKARLEELETTGKRFKSELDTTQDRIETQTSSILAHEALLDEANKAFTHAEKVFNEIADKSIDTSEIDAEIESLKANVDETDNAELTERLKEIERQIARVENNENIDKRIEELNQERQGISQSIADSEKVKFQLEELTRRRTGLLTEEVNSYFRYVEWVLFEEQINGGLKEVCNATIDGCVVGNGLNTGHTILAYVDICNAMQKVYGYDIFMFVDNAESLSVETESRIASSINAQAIFLKVAEQDLEVQ